MSWRILYMNRFYSAVWLILPVLIAPRCAATQEVAQLFSREAIVPARFSQIGAHIEITADSIEWRGTKYRNVRIPVALAQGAIAIDGARAELAGGSAALVIAHDPGGITTVSLQGNSIELGQLAAFDEYLSGVPIDITIDLRSAGESPHALAAAASGTVRVRNSGSGTIKKFLELPDEGSLTDFLVMLNPFRNEARITSVECVVVDLPVVDGIIDDDHVFELMTDVVNVKAAAKIDFDQESVHAAFMPEPRDGVNLSSLAAGDVVVIEGDLAAPKIELMKGRLIEKGVSFGGAIAKLGPSKLFKLIGDARVRASLCADHSPAVDH